LLAVDRLKTGESGIQLAERAQVDLILARYPLPDMSIGSFMQRVHEAGSHSDATPILFLADEQRLAEIRALLPGGARQALSVSQPELLLQEVAARLKLAPRAELRTPVRLQVKLAGQPPLDAQTENVSERGMLVASGTQLPLQARVRFEFALPGERSPVQGEAEVVRHTEQRVEGVNGMGLKVVTLFGDGSARLRRFCSARPR
jgi:CheY-like chemotaxis protein